MRYKIVLKKLLLLLIIDYYCTGLRETLKTMCHFCLHANQTTRIEKRAKIKIYEKIFPTKISTQVIPSFASDVASSRKNKTKMLCLIKHMNILLVVRFSSQHIKIHFNQLFVPRLTKEINSLT